MAWASVWARFRARQADMASARPGALPRTVWMYWHDWAEAPEIAHQSVLSWRLRNPGWTVRTLDRDSVRALIAPDVLHKINTLDIRVQHRSDLIRMELLGRHGGVWADATSFCSWPLDDWLPGYMQEGFFAFSRGSATPERPVANWFLAGVPGSALLQQLRQRIWQYWQGRQEADSYFWFHGLFAGLLATDTDFRDRWNRIPVLSCMHPFHFGPKAGRLAEPPTAAARRLLAHPPGPVYKLTHRLPVPWGPDSLMAAIIADCTKPWPEPGQAGRLVLHIGLPKCASTTLQAWMDGNRQRLRDAGVYYPPSATGETKHQELIRAALKNAFETLPDSLFAMAPGETLFLSTEGLTNHLYDVERDPWTMARLRGLLARFQTTLFMIRRDPESWLRSYHQQQVRNPPGADARFLHGTALTAEELAGQDRIRRLLDTDRLARDARELLGAQEMVVADLEGDWVAALTGLLGIEHMAADLRAAPRLNDSLSPAGTELLRQANASRAVPGRRILIRYLRAGRNGAQGLLDLAPETLPRTFADLPAPKRVRLAAIVNGLTAEPGDTRDLLDALRAILARDLERAS